MSSQAIVSARARRALPLSRVPLQERGSVGRQTLNVRSDEVAIEEQLLTNKEGRAYNNLQVWTSALWRRHWFDPISPRASCPFTRCVSRASMRAPA